MRAGKATSLNAENARKEYVLVSIESEGLVLFSGWSF